MRVKTFGRTLSLSNLDKALYPDGTTKAEVIDYYTRIAPVMLPHLAGREVTRIRYPSLESAGFFEKNAPAGRPSWVPVSPDGLILVSEVATLVWLANLAALELHTPQWRLILEAGAHGRSTDRPADRPSGPDRLVFDLDPGPGAGLDECRAVALALRERLGLDDYSAYAKLSGKKGMQVSSPYTGSFDAVMSYARGIAEEFAKAAPAQVTAQMAKDLRPGKVFIDWSQNHRAKTTICVYSLRAGPSPTVSAPLTWDEVAEGGFAAFSPAEVLERVTQAGDPHAALCS